MKCTFTITLSDDRKKTPLVHLKHTNMKSIDITLLHRRGHEYKSKSILSSWREYIHSNEELWEYNKLGIGAVGVFVQVIIAGVMIAVLGMAHGNLWVGGIGILFAFIADSIVFIQPKILWMMFFVIISILVNASIAIYYLLHYL